MRPPTPANIVSALKQAYPAMYSDLMGKYQPLQYPFSAIDKLFAALPGVENRNHFFGCIVIMYKKFDLPKLKTNALHDGTGDYIARLTGLQAPNVTEYVHRANVYVNRMPGFREECLLLISKILN